MRPDAWTAFRNPAFVRYLSARFLGTLGYQMQGVAVGWQVFELTKNPLHLGLIGLVQFAPLFFLTPVAGHVADRYDRAHVLSFCYLLGVVMSIGLALVSSAQSPNVYWIYPLVAILGVIRAFAGPAAQPLLTSLVTREQFTNAVTWNSSFFHAAVILGPLTGGVAYGLGPKWVHLIAACCQAIGFFGISTLRGRSRATHSGEVSWQSVVAGLKFVWNDRIILGAISLDLCAVLLGGAVALLPAISGEVLHAGSFELGVLRASPALGAVIVGLILTRWPIRKRAGRSLLISVAVFGLATIAFGLSTSLPLSVFALAALGGADMVSVVARQPIVQLRTPDEMRGRVSAVNNIFISAANELGEFESGIMAWIFGTRPSIVMGGMFVLGVVAIWWWRFPALRQLETFDEVHDRR